MFWSCSVVFHTPDCYTIQKSHILANSSRHFPSKILNLILIQI